MISSRGKKILQMLKSQNSVEKNEISISVAFGSIKTSFGSLLNNAGAPVQSVEEETAKNISEDQFSDPDSSMETLPFTNSVQETHNKEVPTSNIPINNPSTSAMHFLPENSQEIEYFVENMEDEEPDNKEVPTADVPINNPSTSAMNFLPENSQEIEYFVENMEDEEPDNKEVPTSNIPINYPPTSATPSGPISDEQDFENFEDDVEDERDPDFHFSSSESESADEENDNPNRITTKKCRPKKGRKPKYLGQTDKTRKSLKNSNSSYTTKRGSAVEKKRFVDYHCSCSEKCYDKVNQEDRQAIFEKFWETGMYNLQNALLCNLVKESEVKRRRTQGNPKRNFTRTYYLENVPVCRDLFVRTLQISTKRVNTALRKFRSLDFQDNRGKHEKHFKISDIQRQAVVSHIEKVPKYKSHYRREQTDREYLPTDMTIESMYNLYKTEVNHKPVSLSTYKKIFYSEFNITRKKLKKDTCNKCDTLHALISSGNADENKKAELECHLKAAEAAREKMNKDFKLAKEIAHIQTFSFDLEKTLPLPRIPTNVMFYKRQLWLYNLGIHSAKEDKSYCFLWMEGTAGRGAQEVGSCIKKYCETFLEETITELHLWSDSCGGQNRNIKLCLILKHILNQSPTLQNIYMKFLVSGHSFLPNDSDFGDIEKALKYQQRLYTPEDYINVMKSSRKKNSFVIHKMSKEDFISSEVLEKSIVNRKKDTIGEKVNWLNVKEIKIDKKSPFSVFFKFSHDQDMYVEVDIKPKQKSKQIDKIIFSQNLPVLYPNGKPISTPKLNDIRSVMHLIPEADQHFYASLIDNEDVVDDIDGYNGEVDFEFQED